MLGDHGQPMGEHDDHYMLLRNLYEESLRIPLLILADGRIAQPTVVHDVGSEVDLIPTLMDVLDLSGVNHALGTSLRRSNPGRPVFFINPFGLAWIGMREGQWKYINVLRLGQRMLFDLDADPYETTNLSDNDPERTARMHDRTFAATSLIDKLIESERIAPYRMSP